MKPHKEPVKGEGVDQHSHFTAEDTGAQRPSTCHRDYWDSNQEKSGITLSLLRACC